jgi:hypothetical protein
MKSMKNTVSSVCIHCGSAYIKYRPQQSFCTGTCRQRHFWATLRHKAARYDELQATKQDPETVNRDLFSSTAV